MSTSYFCDIIDSNEFKLFYRVDYHEVYYVYHVVYYAYHVVYYVVYHVVTTMCHVGWLIMTVLQNGSFWVVVGSFCSIQTDEFNPHTWIVILIVTHNIFVTNFSFTLTLHNLSINYIELTSRFLINLIDILQNINLYFLLFYYQYLILNIKNNIIWQIFAIEINKLILILILSKFQILFQLSWYLKFSYTVQVYIDVLLINKYLDFKVSVVFYKFLFVSYFKPLLTPLC